MAWTDPRGPGRRAAGRLGVLLAGACPCLFAASAWSGLDPIAEAEDRRDAGAPALVEGLRSRSPRTRVRVAVALGRNQQPASIDPLLRLSRDPVGRASALFALGQLAWKAGFAGGREPEIAAAVAGHLGERAPVTRHRQATGKAGFFTLAGTGRRRQSAGHPEDGEGNDPYPPGHGTGSHSCAELRGTGAKPFLRWQDLARVAPNFVIQGGSPSELGAASQDFMLRAEVNPRRFGRGAVGMSRADPFNTGDSRIFITHEPAPRLDGQHTHFGQVIQGMRVVDRIEAGDRIRVARVAERAGRRPRHFAKNSEGELSGR